MQGYENRVGAWERVASDLPLAKLEDTIEEYSLTDLPELGPKILAGQVRGRAVIDVNK